MVPAPVALNVDTSANGSPSAPYASIVSVSTGQACTVNTVVAVSVPFLNHTVELVGEVGVADGVPDITPRVLLNERPEGRPDTDQPTKSAFVHATGTPGMNES